MSEHGNVNRDSADESIDQVQANNTRPKTLRVRRIGWTILGILTLCLIAINIHYAMQLAPLNEELDQLRTQRRTQIATMSLAPKQVALVSLRDQQRSSESRPIVSRLAHVRELDDFCCVTGDEIFSTNVLDRKQGYSIYFYVPKGTHRLVFCQYESDGQQMLLGSKRFDRRDAIYKKLPLEGNRHYRIQFSPGRVSGRRKPNPIAKYFFTVSSTTDTLATEQVELPFTPTSFSVRSNARCYPSQLTARLSQDHQSHVMAAIQEAISTGRPRLPVEIAVADYRALREQTLVRFLIESDASPNIVCGDFPASATMIKNALGAAELKDARESVFDDGGDPGRFHFRTDFLEQQRKESK